MIALAALDSLDRLGEIPSLTFRLHDGASTPHRAHGQYTGFQQAPCPAWDLLALELRAADGQQAVRARRDEPRLPVHVRFLRGADPSGPQVPRAQRQGARRRDRAQHRELGVDFFYLWGDTVTLNVKSFTAFCDELIARKLPIQWFGNARADNLTDPAFVHRLKKGRLLDARARDRVRVGRRP